MHVSDDLLHLLLRAFKRTPFIACGLIITSYAFAVDTNRRVQLDIDAGDLGPALNRFAEQTGLQTVYDPKTTQGLRVAPLHGELPIDEAMDRLLAGSNLRWLEADEMTILVKPKAKAMAAASTNKRPQRPRASSNSIAKLTDYEVSADPVRVLPDASTTSFGFNKPLMETPRAVSSVSEEVIDLFALTAVEDLLRVAPGVYTTTRFGIQGSVDIRHVPADTYFRGMKRLTLQGHGRSVLAAMDSIEIVRGPPSPLYGMGKMGGYTNLEPKSGRAKTGAYLTDMQGFAQVVAGDYRRREASFGIGGPLSGLQRFDKRGGYYVYGLLEDSESYAEGVPVEQQVLQAALSVDDFIGSVRLEAGVNYQESRTAGALTGRFNQALVDEGRYIRGVPLVDLDANDNGYIGYLEQHAGSPAQGALAAGNQPLIQTWDWPRDESGVPLPIGQFPAIGGIPRTLYDYLIAHPEADPTGLLRAQGIGGPTPQSGAVPVGMALDPRTVGYDQLNWRRAAAFERDLKAQFVTLFFDLIHDHDPNFTIKNQFFFDGMHQYKNSNQPFVQQQDVYVVEDKLTLTRRIENVPSWMRVNALASFNLRQTVSDGKSSGTADYSTHRTDAMADTWSSRTGGMIPNTTFASPIDNPDLYADGFPWASHYRTRFTEAGVGLLLDVDLFSRFNVLTGVRYDSTRARNTDFAGAFDPTVGTSANPGLFDAQDQTVKGTEGGVSWSVSLSYEAPFNMRPYVTFSESSILLDGNNNALSNNTIAAGHVGRSELREAGFKTSWLEERLFFAGSVFEQARLDVHADDAPAIIYAYPTATRGSGWESELKWVPLANAFVSVYALRQTTKFDPNVGSTQLVDARTLGFQDVVDPEGNVIYPAEAFLYGGRSRVVLPPGVRAYEKKQGNPETQVGWIMGHTLPFGVEWTLSGNYLSGTCTGRLCTVRLPSSTVYNVGAKWGIGPVELKLDVFNVSNERYFRARTGDTLGNVLAQVMPDRHWQLTLKTRF